MKQAAILITIFLIYQIHHVQSYVRRTETLICVEISFIKLSDNLNVK